MESNQMGATVILPDFRLFSRANQRWQYSGLDSLKSCMDKEHFLSYPYEIEYAYNSLGFRDKEWPESLEELKNAIWCVGDSFTVGIGQPFDHIWPQTLAKTIHNRTINVSMDGASNDWIARKVQRIVDVIAPKNIVIMWSYTHRRELLDTRLPDEARRQLSGTATSQQDYLHWVHLKEQIENLDGCIIQTTIPNFHHYDFTIDSLIKVWNNIKDPSWPACPVTFEELQMLPNYILNEINTLHRNYHQFENVLNRFNDIIYIHQRLDWARDGHHFDLITSQWLVDQICPHLDR